jgi:hypothetical protein
MRLGTWSTPTRNRCYVLLTGEDAFHSLEFRWDRWPPRAYDELYYRIAILPAVTRCAQEFLELPGPTVAVKS